MKKLILLIAKLFIIMTTATAQNPGEVIFSSTPIDPQNPQNIQTDFKAGEHIYAVAYLPDALKNLYQNQTPDATLQVEVFIYDMQKPLYSYQQPMETQLTFANMWVNGSVKDSKHLLIDIVPEPTKTSAYGGKEITYKQFGKKYEGPVAFTEALANLTPGEHRLKVAINCYYAPVAKGEITLSGDNYAVYNDLAVKINDAATNAGTNHAEFPQAVTDDPARVTKMIAAVKNSNDWKNGRFDASEIVKVNITYDWEIRYHEISGAILHRYCIAAFGVKTKSGGCAYYKVTFQEDYTNGNFQPLHYDGAGDKVTLNCEALR